MRSGFLYGFVVIMWVLIILGGFVLIKVVAPVQLEAGDLPSSALKAVIALSMVAAWIWILVTLKNAYVRRKLTAKD